MNCKYCGTEYSDTVVKLHEERCPKRPDVEKSEAQEKDELQELRKMAEELGIENWQKKGAKRLREEIEAAEKAV